MNEIQSLEIDVESVTQLNHALRMETEKYHQIALDLKNETDQCQLESEKWTEGPNFWHLFSFFSLTNIFYGILTSNVI